MTPSPISAAVVPVTPPKRPVFWLVLLPRHGHNPKSQHAWMSDVYQSEQDAKDDAAQTPGAIVFKLPGTGDET